MGYTEVMLYLVSTPIGNLKDITLRALEVLGSVNLILCEDTRKTGILLAHHKISPRPKLLSYQEHNELRRIPKVIKLLKGGENIALVSNAGTPTISDPGYRLVRECIKEGITVEAIPGSSAILTALIISGMPTDKFLFLGFFPRKSVARRKLLTALGTIHPSIAPTYIAFESPHRLINSLRDILEILGDIKIVVSRELTKLYEEVRREKVSEAIKHFSKTAARGEITLVFRLSQTLRV